MPRLVALVTSLDCSELLVETLAEVEWTALKAPIGIPSSISSLLNRLPDMFRVRGDVLL